jgi:hypothetical protein
LIGGKLWRVFVIAVDSKAKSEMSHLTIAIRTSVISG